MRLFNFGRNNRLFVGTPIVSDDDWGKVVGWWTSGRIFGHYISIYIPKFW
jgi:hypothetical protein